MMGSARALVPASACARSRSPARCWRRRPLSARVERVEILGARAARRRPGVRRGRRLRAARAAGCTTRSIPPTPPTRRIVDLELAPRDARGLVTFAGDFLLLRPLDLARGNHRLLYEVGNRGNARHARVLRRRALDQRSRERGRPRQRLPAAPGLQPALERLELGRPAGRRPPPDRAAGRDRERRPDHRPGRGRVRADAAGAERALHVGQLARLPAARARRGGGAGSPCATSSAAPGSRSRASGGASTVRTACSTRRASSPGGSTSWSTPRAIRASSVSASPRSAMRSASSASRPPTRPARPTRWRRRGAPDPAAALAFGISQSGRVLQHMLLEALHVDEAGRMVFDGALVHVAGGGKGSFNHRFAQTTRHPSHLEDHQYPADVFPFATTPQQDPVTGATGDVLARARAAGALPKLFYTMTSTEYWTRSASLLHTDVAGRRRPAARRQRAPLRVRRRPARQLAQPLARTLPELRQSARPPAADARSAAGAGRLGEPRRGAARERVSAARGRHAGLGRRLSDGVPGDPGRRAAGEQPAAAPARSRAALREPRHRRPAAAGLRPAVRHPRAAARCRRQRPGRAAAAGDRGCRLAPIPAGTCAGPRSARRTSSPAGRARSSRSRAPRRSGAAAGDPRPSLAARYRSRSDYESQIEAAARELVAEGFLLGAEIAEITRRAGAFHDRLRSHEPDDPSCAFQTID